MVSRPRHCSTIKRPVQFGPGTHLRQACSTVSLDELETETWLDEYCSKVMARAYLQFPEDAEELVDRLTAWTSSSRQEDESGTPSTNQPFVKFVSPTTRLGLTSRSLQSECDRNLWKNHSRRQRSQLRKIGRSMILLKGSESQIDKHHMRNASTNRGLQESSHP